MAMSDLRSVMELFTRRVFRIPDYQRGYAWGREQLEQFWDDLITLDPLRVRYHYTGVLTLQPIRYEELTNSNRLHEDVWLFNHGYKPFHIIDGQQRLVTIVILSSVILDRFNAEEVLNGHQKKYLFQKLIAEQTGNHHSAIVGYETDRSCDDYLACEILGVGESVGSAVQETLYTGNLKNAKRFFTEQTRGLSKPELAAILDKALNSLRFHVYEVDDEVDVFLRFETINNRGKSLSSLELLKNRLIYLATILPEPNDQRKRLRGQVNDTWKIVYEYLGKNKALPLEEEDFLRNHWLMYSPAEYETSDDCLPSLFSEHFTAKKILDPTTTTPLGSTEIESYLHSLSRSVRNWVFLFNPSISDYSEGTRDWLERVKRNSLGTFRPLMMAALTRGLPDASLNEVLKAVYEFQSASERLVMPKSKTRALHLRKMAHTFYHDHSDAPVEAIVKTIRQMKEQAINSTLFLVS